MECWDNPATSSVVAAAAATAAEDSVFPTFHG